MKIIVRRFLFLVALLLLVILVLAGCSSSKRSQPPASQVGENTFPPGPATGQEATRLQEFTLEELAKYDGTNGKPAYIAVNGLVYDVTNAKAWKEGGHKPWSDKRAAGRDLTTELGKAPPSTGKRSSGPNYPWLAGLKARGRGTRHREAELFPEATLLWRRERECHVKLCWSCWYYL